MWSTLADVDQLARDRLTTLVDQPAGLLDRRAPALADTGRRADELTVVVDENVQFTVYRPRSLVASEWQTVLAFAHLAEARAPSDPDPVDEFRRQAEAMLGPLAAGYRVRVLSKDGLILGADRVLRTERARRLRLSLRDGLRTTVSCPAACGFTVSVVIGRRAPRKYRLGRSRVLVRAERGLTEARDRTVSIELDPSTQRKLRRAEGIGLALRTVTEVADGRVLRRSTPMTLVS